MIRTLSLALALVTVFAQAGTLPKTVDVSLDKAISPIGYDDNDRVQFAVEGVFPDTCYRIGPHALRVDDEKRTITIQQQAYKYSSVCLPVQVPFVEFIEVGLLKEGEYTLVDYQTKKELGKMPVLRSSNVGPDDFLYAPITDAYLINDIVAKKNTLVINGTFADRCSTLEQVKVQYQDQVLVVQPIMKRLEGRCEGIKTRFQKVVELEKELHGMYLLHVRSLNGQAINRMVDFQ